MQETFLGKQSVSLCDLSFTKFFNYVKGIITNYLITGSLLHIVDLTTHRESYEVSADAEASTLASSHADRGSEDIQHGEHGSSKDGNGGDLIKSQGLPGDEEQAESHSHTLNEVLDYTGQEVIHVHVF